MREYIVCFVFWIVFTVLLHGIGKFLCRKTKSTSFYFVTGYLAYSFTVAVAGITIQIFNMPWNIFAIFMVILWIVILAALIVERNKSQKMQWRTILWNYIKDNWVLLSVCIFLSGMLFFYYNAFWYGNHLDDGYYITKVATMPYNATGFRTNYSVGDLHASLDSYIFNTWELEASFYVRILNVKATLFLRLFQSAFQYFLFLNCLKLFAEQIFTKLSAGIKIRGAQFVTVVALLFGGFYLYLQDTNLFFVRDMFQFNSAMFYGSSITKTLSILLLLVFVVEIGRIDIKTMMFFSVVGCVLISKSSIALPLIVITTFAYLEIGLLFHYKEKGRIVALLLGVIYVFTGIFMQGNGDFQEEVYKYVLLAVKSPIMILCTVVFIFSFFWKEQTIIKLNCVMLICMGTMVIPQANDVFETLSVYRFVTGRAWATWAYTYVIINVIYLYWLLYKCLKNKKIVKALYLTSGIILIVSDAVAFDSYGGELFATEEPVDANIKYNLKTILENPYFIPGSTIQLGEELEKLSENRGGELSVVLSEGVSMNGTVHNLAVQIRTFAPNIVVLSAINRYRVDKGSDLEGYSQEYYDKFVTDPSDETGSFLEKELKKYGVNCVVVNKAECGPYLREMGYRLYKKINKGEYYIWSN
ncbi:DUF6077 domain-containing protein [Faecalicatena contorta]|uniref:Uncharacterized protein n=1 Tax=Faecalicatena contorta TaxID=39482 RepID=A0A315ZSW6_9FIRM|nr:DUF6077 domain-containing protein [Faecalicatena contorta]PWJ48372.1 hypothetical protein A8805_11243 [Faecalicatena contorta]SUQ15395.1 hypothetical protein SAMN05216529_11243 [Faecalicatena contorta]